MRAASGHGVSSRHGSAGGGRCRTTVSSAAGSWTPTEGRLARREEAVSTVTIGLAQCRQTADFDANAATILRFVEEAGRAGVRILCFPETQTVGYRVDIATPETPVPVARLEELHGEVARRC